MLSPEEMEAVIAAHAQAVAGCLKNFCCTDAISKPKFLAMYTAYVMFVWIRTGVLKHSNSFDLSVINEMMAAVDSIYQRAHAKPPVCMGLWADCVRERLGLGFTKVLVNKCSAPKLSMFGSTCRGLSSPVTPNHCASGCHTASYGVVGSRRPRPRLCAPASVRSSGKSPRTQPGTPCAHSLIQTHRSTD